MTLLTPSQPILGFLLILLCLAGCATHVVQPFSAALQR